jgi:soluble P-type ATPase
MRNARIQALSDLGVSAVMLTGGQQAHGCSDCRRALGLEPRAELLPQDKQRIVGELRAAGQTVAKIGDGINDAPALAAADVGIAMGGGTDVALETADAAVLHGRVMDVAGMVALSRATMSNIWQNITIALGFEGGVLGDDRHRRHRAMACDPGGHRGDGAGDRERHAAAGLERIEAGRGLVPVNIPRRQEQAFLAIGCFHPNTEACQASSVRP